MRQVSPGGMLSIGVVVVRWGKILVGVTLAEEVSVGMVALHTGSETSNTGGGNAPMQVRGQEKQTDKHKAV